MTVFPEFLKIDTFRFIPIAKNSKIPPAGFKDFYKGNNYHWNATELQEHLKYGGNYAILAGINRLIIIDCDDIRLVEAVKQFLPPTFSVKTSQNHMHFYFFCPDIERKIILALEGVHCGEILASGCFVVGPNSVHPSGAIYTIVNDISIVTITRADIGIALREFLPNIQKKKQKKTDSEDNSIVSTGGILPDGRLYEEIVQNNVECFVVYNPNTDVALILHSILLETGDEIIPRPVLGAERQALTLPDGIEEYGTTTELLREMENFGRKELDTGNADTIFRVMVRLALMSWAPEAQDGLGERFTPIIVVRGPSETGKKRFLTVFRFYCRRSLYQLKSHKVPSLFRGLQIWDAIPILDEADFRDSSESAEVVQFFNSRADGVPISRYDTEGRTQQWFASFGLSILAMRKEANDDGFNSRSFVYPAQGTRRPDDFDLLPPKSWTEEGMRLQRKLLLWRLRHYKKIIYPTKFYIEGVRSFRVREALLGLKALTSEDSELAGDIEGLAHDFERRVVAERANSSEGMVLGIIYSAIQDREGETIAINNGWRIEMPPQINPDSKEDPIKEIITASWVCEQLGKAISQADIVRIWRGLGQDIIRQMKIGGHRYRSILKVKEPARLDYDFQKYVQEAEPLASHFQRPLSTFADGLDMQSGGTSGTSGTVLALNEAEDGQSVPPVPLVPPNHMSEEVEK